MRNKNDKLYAKYLVRPISTRISRLLVRTSITPNQITIIGFLIGLVSAYMFFTGLFFIGSMVFFIATILDHCDGEIARKNGKVSQLGKWLDPVLDRALHGLVIFALAYALNDRMVWVFAFLALLFMSIHHHSWDLHQRFFKDSPLNKGFAIFEEVSSSRAIIIILGAMFNQVALALFILALFHSISLLKYVPNKIFKN